MTGFRGEVKEVGEQTAKVDKVYGRATPVDLALGQIELVPGNSNWGTTRRWARHHTASAICGAVAGVTSRHRRTQALRFRQEWSHGTMLLRHLTQLHQIARNVPPVVRRGKRIQQLRLRKFSGLLVRRTACRLGS
jgi:hypothetical protein